MEKSRLPPKVTARGARLKRGPRLDLMGSARLLGVATGPNSQMIGGYPRGWLRTHPSTSSAASMSSAASCRACALVIPLSVKVLT